MGNQTAITSSSASPADVISAASRTSAIVSGETAASVSASTRLREGRSSSKMVRIPNRTPPTAPPAMAGLARYWVSMVLAVAGRYSVSPTSGESTVNRTISQVRRLCSSLLSSSQNSRIVLIVPPPPQLNRGRRPPATAPPALHTPAGRPPPPGSGCRGWC